MSSIVEKINSFQHKLVHNIHYNFDLKQQDSFLLEDVFKDEDEVMIAREIRLNYPLLEVVDGRSVRRKYPFLKETGIEETVYIVYGILIQERLGGVRKSDFVDKVLGENFSCFGTIMDIYVDEKQIYGFIKFHDKSSVEAAMSTNFENKYKAITKKDWNQLMQQYYNSFLVEKQRIQNLKLSRKGNYGKLEYKPNVIGLLQGLHKGTNSKVIKALTEMIVPVAYVDYQARQTWSYIRFKNENDSQVAASYFSRVYITQSNALDSVGKIGDADACKEHYDLLRKGEPVTGITLQILVGQDESEYWSGIAQIQANLKSVEIDEDVDMEGAHVIFGDDGESLKLNRETKHIIFEDSDGADALEEVQLKTMPSNHFKEKHRKKRHRSMK